MKVTNISPATIYLKDLHLIRQGQSEARRAEDCYVGPGRSVYLPDTVLVQLDEQKVYATQQLAEAAIPVA